MTSFEPLCQTVHKAGPNLGLSYYTSQEMSFFLKLVRVSLSQVVLQKPLLIQRLTEGVSQLRGNSWQQLLGTWKGPHG